MKFIIFLDALDDAKSIDAKTLMHQIETRTKLRIGLPSDLYRKQTK